MPKTYAVLLPNPDGSAGKLAMEGPQGRRVVSQPREAAGFDPDKKSVDLSEKQIAKTFGEALAAAPPKPLSSIFSATRPRSLLRHALSYRRSSRRPRIEESPTSTSSATPIAPLPTHTTSGSGSNERRRFEPS